MKFRFAPLTAHRSSRQWQYRRLPADAPPEAGTKLPTLPALPRTAARTELSPAARRLFHAINCHDTYVICIDPHAIAAKSGISEQTLPQCLNELCRAGMISMWMGNLVFFD